MSNSPVIGQDDQIHFFLRKYISIDKIDLFDSFIIAKKDDFCSVDTLNNEMIFLFKDSLFYETIPFKIEYKKRSRKIEEIVFSNSDFRRLITLLAYEQMVRNGFRFSELTQNLQRILNVHFVECDIPYLLCIEENYEMVPRFQIELYQKSISCDKFESIKKVNDLNLSEFDINILINDLYSKRIDDDTEEFISYVFELTNLSIHEQITRKIFSTPIIDH